MVNNYILVSWVQNLWDKNQWKELLLKYNLKINMISYYQPASFTFMYRFLGTNPTLYEQISH